jgi:hypothetical protein
MKRILTLLLVAACPFVANAKTMFVMHGGAGTITRQNMTAEAEAQIRAKLEEALKAGHAILARGGTSLDAVCDPSPVPCPLERFAQGTVDRWCSRERTTGQGLRL